jgi:SAM-dependent methyltransferase
MVIEERGLVHVPGTDKRLGKSTTSGYYSSQRLRRLSEKPHLADPATRCSGSPSSPLFRLVESGRPGERLGVAPLGGDLFNREALGVLEDCSLDNATFLGASASSPSTPIRSPARLIRVNYGALNVEEFGSVYQGLLEFEPRVGIRNRRQMALRLRPRRRARRHRLPLHPGRTRPAAHQALPRLPHRRPLKDPTPPSRPARNRLRVADISCGSGHILLAAARRIATELAIVRTGEEQPSPAAYREAVRDVIRECIYGVDLNPLAVELCKVALWLEAHVPGEPLNFLDHHIKCGNAIVGFVTRDELDKRHPRRSLQNPPRRRQGTNLSGRYGHSFCEYVKWEYAPTGLSDLVAYFVRRIFDLLRPGGFTAFITTNSIKDGDIRKDSLEVVESRGGTINMAVRGIKWPGKANLVVSLVALRNGDWNGPRILDGKAVPVINPSSRTRRRVVLQLNYVTMLR